MWKAAFSGRSETGSTAGRSSSQKKKSSGSVVSSTSRDDRRKSGKSSRGSTYDDYDDQSAYYTAPSSRVGEPRRLTESAVNALSKDDDMDWEDEDKDARSERRSVRSGKSGRSERHRRRGDKSRSRSRERETEKLRKEEKRKSSRRESELSRGKARGGDVYEREGERAMPEMGSFEQFPGQYSGGMMGQAGQADHMMSGALSGGPSQAPDNQFGPTREDSYGAAAGYYLDEGQSVQHQPGVRTNSPNMLVNPDHHLHAASLEAQPAQDTGHGSAADFYGGDIVMTEEPQPINKPGKQPAPSSSSSSKPSKPGRTSSLGTAAAATAALGMAAAGSSSYHHQQSSSYSRPGGGSIGGRPGRVNSEQVSPGIVTPQYPQSAQQQGSNGSYYGPPPRQSSQGTPGKQSVNGTYYGAMSGQGTPTRPATDGSYYATPPARQSEGKTGKHSAHHSNAGIYAAGAAAAGAAGYAAYEAKQHHDQRYSQSQSQYDGTQYSRPPGYAPSAAYTSGSYADMQYQRGYHEHRGPMTKLKDGFLNLLSTEEDVVKMEAYTEAIGVCKYCFDPRSSPWDAPRRHHYHSYSPRRDSFEDLRRRRSLDKLRKHGSKEYLGGRVDKDSRYFSSDSKRKSGSKADLAAAGLAGVGLAAGANAVFNSGKDFEDTYSVKSGHRPSSAARRRSRSSSREQRRKSTHGIIGRDSRDEYTFVRTKDGRTEKRRVQRSRSRSDDGRSGITGAAAGAALGASALAARSSRRRHSRSRSRSSSPGLANILGFSDSKSKRGRRSPNGSSYDFSHRPQREEQQSSGIFGGFFTSPSPKRRNSKPEHRKKTAGFFNFGNGSSSSSDTEMAFGEGFSSKTNLPLRRKSSNRSVKRKGSDQRLAATVAGIGATAAALAAAQKGHRITKRTSRPELRAKRRQAVQQDSSDEEWEDELPSDASSGSSLAFGDYEGRRLSRRQSKDSMNSTGSGAGGLGAWGWRWGGKKDKKKRRVPSPPPAYPPRPDSSIIAPAAAAGVAAVTAKEATRPSYDSRGSSMSGVLQPPMQFVDPRPVSEDSSMAGSGRVSSMPGGFNFDEPPVVRPGPAPLQQPQPVAPIQPAFTDRTNEDFFDRPKPRRTMSSPTQSSFGMKDAAMIGAAAIGTASIIASQSGRRSREPKDVRFGLTEEQQAKEDREKRKEREKVERNERARADRERALKEEAERHTREQDVLRRREEENRRAAEARVEREREAELQRMEQEAVALREKERQEAYEREEARKAEEVKRQDEARRRREAEIDAEIEAKRRELEEQRQSRDRRNSQSDRRSERRDSQSDKATERSSSIPWGAVAAGAAAAATAGAVYAGVEHEREKDHDPKDRHRDSDLYTSRETAPSKDSPSLADHDVFDPSFFKRKRSPNRSPSGDRQIEEIARKAFEKIRDDKGKEDYDGMIREREEYYHEPQRSQADVFAPKEILERNAGYKERATEDGVKGAREEGEFVFDEELYGPSSFDRSRHAPFGVPKLGLIAPTPPPEKGPREPKRRETSPLSRSEVGRKSDQDYDDDVRGTRSEPGGRKSSRSRSISWGEPQMHVYEVRTPESFKEGAEGYIDAKDVDVGAAAAAAAAGVAGAGIYVADGKGDHDRRAPAEERSGKPTGLDDSVEEVIDVDDEAEAGYRKPFSDIAADLGFDVDSPGTEGAPPVRGFVEGEVDATPKDERGPHIPGGWDDDATDGDYFDGQDAPALRDVPLEVEEDIPYEMLSKKEKKKRDKAAKRAEALAEELPTPPAFEPEPEPALAKEAVEEEIPYEMLSKKDKKKRDKAQWAGTLEEDLPTPPAAVEPEPEPATTVKEEIPYEMLSKKDKKKRDKEAKKQGFADVAAAAMTTAGVAAVAGAAANEEDSGESWEAASTSTGKKGKKGKKAKAIERDIRDIEPSMPSTVDGGWEDKQTLSPAEAVDPFQYQIKDDSPPAATPTEVEAAMGAKEIDPMDEFAEVKSSKKSKKKAKRDSLRFSAEPEVGSPLRSEVNADDYLAGGATAEADVPPTNGYATEEVRPIAEEPHPGEERMSRSASKYQVDSRPLTESPRRISPDDMRSVASEPTGTRERRRRSKTSEYYDEGETDPYDDVRSVAASEPADMYERRRSKRRSRTADDDDGMSVVSSSSRRERDDGGGGGGGGKKEKKGFFGGLFGKKASSPPSGKAEGATLSRSSTRESRGGVEEDGERRHRRRRSGPGGDDDDDTRSVASESRHRQYHRRRTDEELPRSSRSESGSGRRLSRRWTEDDYRDEDQSFLGKRVEGLPPLPADEMTAPIPAEKDDRGFGRPGLAGRERAEGEGEKGGVFQGPGETVQAVESPGEEEETKTHAEAVETLPPLPESPPGSPTEVRQTQTQTPHRPLPLQRPTSTTAVPLRFPFGQSPSTPSSAGRMERAVSFGGHLPSSPSTPQHSHHHHKTRQGRPTSTEMMPLYLVEKSRKTPEVEDMLPSLPSSKPSSRASSVVGSDEHYESAAEEWGSPQSWRSGGGRGLAIDVHGADANVEKEDLLDSGQTTPRASERVPDVLAEGFARAAGAERVKAEPQFYTWEDYERDEAMRRAEGEEQEELPALPPSRPESRTERDDDGLVRSVGVAAAAAVVGAGAVLGYHALNDQQQEQREISGDDSAEVTEIEVERPSLSRAASGSARKGKKKGKKGKKAAVFEDAVEEPSTPISGPSASASAKLPREDIEKLVKPEQVIEEGLAPAPTSEGPYLEPSTPDELGLGLEAEARPEAPEELPVSAQAEELPSRDAQVSTDRITDDANAPLSSPTDAEFFEAEQHAQQHDVAPEPAVEPDETEKKPSEGEAATVAGTLGAAAGVAGLAAWEEDRPVSPSGEMNRTTTDVRGPRVDDFNDASAVAPQSTTDIAAAPDVAPSSHERSLDDVLGAAEHLPTLEKHPSPGHDHETAAMPAPVEAITSIDTEAHPEAEFAPLLTRKQSKKSKKAQKKAGAQKALDELLAADAAGESSSAQEPAPTGGEAAKAIDDAAPAQEPTQEEHTDVGEEAATHNREIVEADAPSTSEFVMETSAVQPDPEEEWSTKPTLSRKQSKKQKKKQRQQLDAFGEEEPKVEEQAQEYESYGTQSKPIEEAVGGGVAPAEPVVSTEVVQDDPQAESIQLPDLEKDELAVETNRDGLDASRDTAGAPEKLTAPVSEAVQDAAAQEHSVEATQTSFVDIPEPVEPSTQAAEPVNHQVEPVETFQDAPDTVVEPQPEDKVVEPQQAPPAEPEDEFVWSTGLKKKGKKSKKAKKAASQALSWDEEPAAVRQEPESESVKDEQMRGLDSAAEDPASGSVERNIVPEEPVVAHEEPIAGEEPQSREDDPAVRTEEPVSSIEASSRQEEPAMPAEDSSAPTLEPQTDAAGSMQIDHAETPITATPDVPVVQQTPHGEAVDGDEFWAPTTSKKSKKKGKKGKKPETATGTSTPVTPITEETISGTQPDMAEEPSQELPLEVDQAPEVTQTMETTEPTSATGEADDFWAPTSSKKKKKGKKASKVVFDAPAVEEEPVIDIESATLDPETQTFQEEPADQTADTSRDAAGPARELDVVQDVPPVSVEESGDTTRDVAESEETPVEARDTTDETFEQTTEVSQDVTEPEQVAPATEAEDFWEPLPSKKRKGKKSKKAAAEETSPDEVPQTERAEAQDVLAEPVEEPIEAARDIAEPEPAPPTTEADDFWAPLPTKKGKKGKKGKKAQLETLMDAEESSAVTPVAEEPIARAEAAALTLPTAAIDDELPVRKDQAVTPLPEEKVAMPQLEERGLAEQADVASVDALMEMDESASAVPLPEDNEDLATPAEFTEIAPEPETFDEEAFATPAEAPGSPMQLDDPAWSVPLPAEENEGLVTPVQTSEVAPTSTSTEGEDAAAQAESPKTLAEEEELWAPLSKKKKGKKGKKAQTEPEPATFDDSALPSQAEPTEEPSTFSQETVEPSTREIEPTGEDVWAPMSSKKKKKGKKGKNVEPEPETQIESQPQPEPEVQAEPGAAQEADLFAEPLESTAMDSIEDPSVQVEANVEPEQTLAADEDNFWPTTSKKSKKKAKKSRTLEQEPVPTPAPTAETEPIPAEENVRDAPTAEAESVPAEEVVQDAPISTDEVTKEPSAFPDDGIEPQKATPAVEEEEFWPTTSKKSKKKGKKSRTLEQEPVSESISTDEPEQIVTNEVVNEPQIAADGVTAEPSALPEEGPEPQQPTPAAEEEEFWPTTSKKSKKKGKKSRTLEQDPVQEKVATDETEPNTAEQVTHKPSAFAEDSAEPERLAPAAEEDGFWPTSSKKSKKKGKKSRTLDQDAESVATPSEDVAPIGESDFVEEPSGIPRESAEPQQMTPAAEEDLWALPSKKKKGKKGKKSEPEPMAEEPVTHDIPSDNPPMPLDMQPQIIADTGATEAQTPAEAEDDFWAGPTKKKKGKKGKRSDTQTPVVAPEFGEAMDVEPDESRGIQDGELRAGEARTIHESFDSAPPASTEQSRDVEPSEMADTAENTAGSEHGFEEVATGLGDEPTKLSDIVDLPDMSRANDQEALGNGLDPGDRDMPVARLEAETQAAGAPVDQDLPSSVRQFVKADTDATTEQRLPQADEINAEIAASSGAHNDLPPAVQDIADSDANFASHREAEKQDRALSESGGVDEPGAMDFAATAKPEPSTSIEDDAFWAPTSKRKKKGKKGKQIAAEPSSDQAVDLTPAEARPAFDDIEPGRVAIDTEAWPVSEEPPTTGMAAEAATEESESFWTAPAKSKKGKKAKKGKRATFDVDNMPEESKPAESVWEESSVPAAIMPPDSVEEIDNTADPDVVTTEEPATPVEGTAGRGIGAEVAPVEPAEAEQMELVDDLMPPAADQSKEAETVDSSELQSAAAENFEAVAPATDDNRQPIDMDEHKPIDANDSEPIQPAGASNDAVETPLEESPLAFSTKKSKKDKKKAKKGKTISADSRVEEPAEASQAPSWDDSDAIGAAGAVAGGTLAAGAVIAGTGTEAEEMPKQEDGWPSFSTKKSKKDKRKGKKSGTATPATPLETESPDPISEPMQLDSDREVLAGADRAATEPFVDDDTAFPSRAEERLAADPVLHEQANVAEPRDIGLHAEPLSRETSNVESTERELARQDSVPADGQQDIDFTATLAAGLQDSGFDPEMVVNDPTFHRRATPPGTTGEADPEEVFESFGKKKKKKGKKGKQADIASEEQSRDASGLPTPENATNDFDEVLAQSLEGTGIDPSALERASAGADAPPSDDLTGDGADFSFGTSRRKKGKKKARAVEEEEPERTSETMPANSAEPYSAFPETPASDAPVADNTPAETVEPAEPEAQDVAAQREIRPGLPRHLTIETNTTEPSSTLTTTPGTPLLDPAADLIHAGERDMDVDDMDKAYRAYKRNKRKQKKQKWAAMQAEDSASQTPQTTDEAAPVVDVAPELSTAGGDITAEAADAVRGQPHEENIEQVDFESQGPPATDDVPSQMDTDAGDSLHTSEVSQSLPTAFEREPSTPTGEPSPSTAASQEHQGEERSSRGTMSGAETAGLGVAATAAAIGAGALYNRSSSRHRDRSAHSPRLESKRSLGLLPNDRSPTSHDGGSDKEHQVIRDSGYQTSSPRWSRQSAETSNRAVPDIASASSRENLHTRRSNEALHISTDTGPAWDLKTPKKRSSENASEASKMLHARTPSQNTQDTPLEPTSRNRASYLFQSTPENLRTASVEGTPTQGRDSNANEYFSPSDHDGLERSFSNPDRAAFSPPLSGVMSPRIPLDTIPEEHLAHKRSIGEMEARGSDLEKVSSRRTVTPQSIRARERAFSPTGLPPLQTASNSGRSISNPGIEEVARTSDLRSPSVMSNRSNVSANHWKSPDELRSYSRTSNRSNTPSLRRTSLSGDLRAASRRGDSGSAVGARSSPKTIPFEAPPTPPSNDDEVMDAGASRSRDMSDVYQGYGDAQASQVSPTRPPSMRKRQSMHIMDLESKLEQLAAENSALQASKQENGSSRGLGDQSLDEALRTRDLELQQKDNEIAQMRAMLQPMQDEIARLNEMNEGLTEANRNLVDDTNGRYATLQQEHAEAQEQWQSASRELDGLREEHGQLTSGLRAAVEAELTTALASKNSEIRGLREELEVATERIRALQVQIQATKGRDFLTVRDEDYFDGACQKLCQHVQQWVLRFSKTSDTRVSRLSTDVSDDKVEARLDNAILDGSDVDKLLSDRVRRRDVFMSVVMTMVWEYVFTRYLFGMERDQRQKLKILEKLLQEVGPKRAVAQWRATTLTLLAKRPQFAEQRDRDEQAVASEIFDLLCTLLPPPSSNKDALLASLGKVIHIAVDLSIEMRTQRSEYIMLPPLLPEYDQNGDLMHKVHFNASLMNERSGLFSSNEALEQGRAVVKIVLFPLVVKKGDEVGEGEEEIVVCPAQVLVHNDGQRGKKVVRVESGHMTIDDPRRSRASLVSGAGSGAF